MLSCKSHLHLKNSLHNKLLDSSPSVRPGSQVLCLSLRPPLLPRVGLKNKCSGQVEPTAQLRSRVEKGATTSQPHPCGPGAAVTPTFETNYLGAGDKPAAASLTRCLLPPVGAGEAAHRGRRVASGWSRAWRSSRSLARPRAQVAQVPPWRGCPAPGAAVPSLPWRQVPGLHQISGPTGFLQHLRPRCARPSPGLPAPGLSCFPQVPQRPLLLYLIKVGFWKVPPPFSVSVHRLDGGRVQMRSCW